MRQVCALVILITGLLVGSTWFTVVPASNPTDIPPEFQTLYSSLKANMDSFDGYLDTQKVAENYPTIFAAELLPANDNRGTDLLTPQALQGAILWLDRLQELGVQGVTIPIGYPLYTPSFPHYQNYVQFYKQVVQEVRNRGMKIDIESAVIFANTPFSKLQVSYAGLTFEQFEAERKQMIAAIIQDLHPDYLNLGAEPDTEARLLGMQELNDPQKYGDYISYVLNGLDRGDTKIGAGIGTWGNTEYVDTLLTTSLDSIHIHVYPITGQGLQNIMTVAQLAEQHGKRVVLDEAWLFKTTTPSPNSVAGAPGVFRLDAFSFWAPLDQQFLGTIIKAAQVAKIDYVSPFWTTLFFGYVDYNSSTAQLPYVQMVALLNENAAKNITADQFTSTGQFYKTVIASFSSSTTSSLTSASPTTGSRFPALLLMITGIIVAAAITLAVLTRPRQSRRLKSG